MARIVAHYRKVGTAAGLHALGRHVERDGAYDDAGKPTPGKWANIIVHPENRTRNEYSYAPEGLLSARRNLIESAGLKRKPQKNAAAAVELVVSASPEFFQAQSESGQRRYFAAARKWIEGEFGKNQVLGWAVHYDEKTPHMHVLMVPLTKTMEVRKRKKGKDVSREVVETDEWVYSSSRFLGGPQGLLRLHDDLAKALAPFGVERGLLGSKARHTDQVEWIASLKIKEKELRRQQAELVERRAAFMKAIDLKMEPFKPDLQRKSKLSALLTYTASDGTTDLPWDKYVVKEITLQAQAYVDSLLTVVKAQRIRVVESEAAVKELPKLKARIAEYETFIHNVKNMTPSDLRSIANKREAEIAHRKELSRERKGVEPPGF